MSSLLDELGNELMGSESPPVVELDEGPSLAFAEVMPSAESEVGLVGGCPTGTLTVVKTTWKARTPPPPSPSSRPGERPAPETPRCLGFLTTLSYFCSLHAQALSYSAV